MVVFVLERGKPANHPWNVRPVIFYVCAGSRTAETCQPSRECVSCGSLCFCWFQNAENLPTIPGKFVLWFFMIVLVLEHGKPAKHAWNVFPVVLYGFVGSRDAENLPTIPGMCFL
jgi:hypothetical protein